MKVLWKVVVFFITIILFMMSNIFVDGLYGMLALVFLLMFCVIYIISDVSDRLSFGFYILAVYTFLVSRQLSDFIRGNDFLQGFSNVVFVKACNCILLSIIFVYLGFNYSNKFTYNKNKKFSKIVDSLINEKKYNIEKVSTYSFWITIITNCIALVLSLNKIKTVMLNGYLTVYGYSDSFSAMANRFWLIGRTSIFIGLATTRSRSKVKWLILFGAINPIVELLIGRRGYFVSYILFCIFYFTSFWRKYENKDNQANKKTFKLGLVIGIAAFIILPFLYSYGYTRSGLSYAKYNTLLDGVGKFFYSEGVSFDVIGITISNYGKLPQKWYTLGAWSDALKGVLSKYPDHTFEFAMHSRQLRAIVSYYQNSYVYLNGQGLGSSYIAEVFYDFGYLGLIIVNYVIGTIISRLRKNNANNNFVVISIAYGLLYDFFMLPRSSLLSPIVNLTATSTIITYLFILMLSRRQQTAILE